MNPQDKKLIDDLQDHIDELEEYESEDPEDGFCARELVLMKRIMRRLRELPT